MKVVGVPPLSLSLSLSRRRGEGGGIGDLGGEGGGKERTRAYVGMPHIARMV